MSDRYRVALLGNGIGPSLSPALHMEEARHLGLDYEYRIVDLAGHPHVDLGAELRRLEDAGFHAVNVTHPFKQSVLEHVAHLSPAVRRIGSTNLVLLGGHDGAGTEAEAGYGTREGAEAATRDRPARRTAHNTDCTGFRAALESFLPPGAATGTVLQIGAGGAGLATASALLDMGFERIVVHDVVPAAVDAMRERFTTARSPGSGSRLLGSGGSLDDWLPRADGVVHVTPVGMAEHPGIAFDVARLRRDAWVAEVVYRPLETELVRRARARGLETLDGGGMAVGQAVESLRLITGLHPDIDRMHAHFNQLAED